MKTKEQIKACIKIRQEFIDSYYKVLEKTTDEELRLHIMYNIEKEESCKEDLEWVLK